MKLNKSICLIVGIITYCIAKSEVGKSIKALSRKRGYMVIGTSFALLGGSYLCSARPKINLAGRKTTTADAREGVDQEGRLINQSDNPKSFINDTESSAKRCKMQAEATECNSKAAETAKKMISKAQEPTVIKDTEVIAAYAHNDNKMGRFKDSLERDAESSAKRCKMQESVYAKTAKLDSAKIITSNKPKQ